MHVTDWCK